MQCAPSLTVSYNTFTKEFFNTRVNFWNWYETILIVSKPSAKRWVDNKSLSGRLVTDNTDVTVFHKNLLRNLLLHYDYDFLWFCYTRW